MTRSSTGTTWLFCRAQGVRAYICTLNKMEIGIIGLPNVGKTSLFNLLTRGSAQIGNFPFTTIEPNVGIAVQKDPRLEKLGGIFEPEKLTPAFVKFVDVAGLVKDAHIGEGLGNKFLSHIRPLEVLLQVLGDFRSENVAMMGFGAKEQMEIVETELLLSDIDYAIKRSEKIITAARSGDKLAKDTLSFFESAIKFLNSGKALRRCNLKEMSQKFDFLTSKPVFYVHNSTAPFAVSDSIADVLYIDVKLEIESLELDENERLKFLGEYGITESGPDKIIKTGKKLLNLITFYTVVGKEVRAWNIKGGSRALDGAAMIHTDMAKGFIRADVYDSDLLENYRTEKRLHELGLIRSEGREYKIKDGDILKIHFR